DDENCLQAELAPHPEAATLPVTRRGRIGQRMLALGRGPIPALPELLRGVGGPVRGKSGAASACGGLRNPPSGDWAASICSRRARNSASPAQAWSRNAARSPGERSRAAKKMASAGDSSVMLASGLGGHPTWRILARKPITDSGNRFQN